MIKKIGNCLFCGFVIVLLVGCQSTSGLVATDVVIADPMIEAYKYVLENWQSVDMGDARRGYNIAAVLISPEGRIIAKELNTVISSQDCTQHAEMRLVQRYLKKNRCFNLRGFVVYTTLEPCAMCTATMGMAGVHKVYYGQSDPSFGKSAERLEYNSMPHGGSGPYPRVVNCELKCSPMQQALDDSFKTSGIPEITKWLATDDAKQIFHKYLYESFGKSQFGASIFTD